MLGDVEATGVGATPVALIVWLEAEMLEIPASLFDAMIAHAKQESPMECCGLLAGRHSSVSRIFPLRNELGSPVTYSADPRDLFAAYREMRESDLELVAIYHSHPTSEARPSRIDLAENYYGEVPRVIVSLASPKPVVRAILLYNNHFQEVECRRIALED
jgi:proteasome lid subunit RPN8/RPN11